VQVPNPVQGDGVIVRREGKHCSVRAIGATVAGRTEDRSVRSAIMGEVTGSSIDVDVSLLSTEYST
jgi:hypothetical protein